METAEPLVPLPPDGPSGPRCSECWGEEFEEIAPVLGSATVIYACQTCDALFTPAGVLIGFGPDHEGGDDE